MLLTVTRTSVWTAPPLPRYVVESIRGFSSFRVNLGLHSIKYNCFSFYHNLYQVSPGWSPVEGGVKVQVIGQSMALQKGVQVQFAFSSGNTYKCIETEYIDSKR